MGSACLSCLHPPQPASYPPPVPDFVVQDGTDKAQKVFISVPTEVGQTEAEEIGELKVQELLPKLACAVKIS